MGAAGADDAGLAEQQAGEAAVGALAADFGRAEEESVIF